MTQVNKTTALGVLDDVTAALVVCRPALVRRALLEELTRSSGPPADAQMEATLKLALATVRDPAWPTVIAQLRELVAREGRIRRDRTSTQALSPLVITDGPREEDRVTAPLCAGYAAEGSSTRPATFRGVVSIGLHHDCARAIKWLTP